jgi:hypothetical protein
MDSLWQPFSALYVTTKLKIMQNFPQLLRASKTTRLRSLFRKPEKERYIQPPSCMKKIQIPPLDSIGECKQS